MIEGQAAERFLAAPLLAGVDLEARRAVLECLREGGAREGALLLEQDHPNDRLSILIEGTAVVERTYPGGRKEVLASLTAPAVFGTTSFFGPNPSSVAVRATSDVAVLTLDHPSHERLRRANPRAAEALALAVVRVLAERFDMLDKRVTESLAEQEHDHPKMTEWSGFRARLFEESSL